MINKFFKASIFGDNITDNIFKLIKYSLMFSFVFWLGIIIWNLFFVYKTYQGLKVQQEEARKILQEKEKIIKQYQQKIADIQLAYKELSKVISPKAVKNLTTQLDKYILFLEEEKKSININIYNPFRIIGFNIQLHTQIPSYIQGVSLVDTEISPYIVNLFAKTLQKILKNWDKHIYPLQIFTTVAVDTDNNNIVLYLKPSKTNSALKIKPLLFYGVINDILQMPYFLTTTAVSSSFISDSNFSQFYIGWDLEFNQNKGGLK